MDSMLRCVHYDLSPEENRPATAILVAARRSDQSRPTASGFVLAGDQQIAPHEMLMCIRTIPPLTTICIPHSSTWRRLAISWHALARRLQLPSQALTTRLVSKATGF